MAVFPEVLIRNAAQIIYFEPYLDGLGRQRWHFRTLKNGSLAIAGGKIVSVGSAEEVERQISSSARPAVIEAEGRVVTPGLVDAHTHPVFLLTREREFEMRIQGKSYEEIAAAGGGIRSSVRAVRQAGKEELKAAVRPRLRRFLELGTTTIEAKSGYGLSFEDEIKSLEVLQELNAEGPLEIVPTFLGAHEVPDEYRSRREEYIRLLTGEMIPFVAKKGLAEFCDVFCEEGVYTVPETQRILHAARRAGLKLRLHADQLHRTGATELAVELAASTAEHLEQLGEQDIQRLAGSATFAGLLPGAVFFLGSDRYPPGRKLLDAGARVFLATDFNPGSSMTQSLPLMMTLACLFMQFTPAEALAATTVYAAASLDRADRIGNLLPGHQADIVLWEAADYRMIPYYYGVNLVKTVFKRGRKVFERRS